MIERRQPIQCTTYQSQPQLDHGFRACCSSCSRSSREAARERGVLRHGIRARPGRQLSGIAHHRLLPPPRPPGRLPLPNKVARRRANRSPFEDSRRRTRVVLPPPPNPINPHRVPTSTGVMAFPPPNHVTQTFNQPSTKCPRANPLPIRRSPGRAWHHHRVGSHLLRTAPPPTPLLVGWDRAVHRIEEASALPPLPSPTNQEASSSLPPPRLLFRRCWALTWSKCQRPRPSPGTSLSKKRGPGSS